MKDIKRTIADVGLKMLNTAHLWGPAAMVLLLNYRIDRLSEKFNIHSALGCVDAGNIHILSEISKAECTELISVNERIKEIKQQIKDLEKQVEELKDQKGD